LHRDGGAWVLTGQDEPGPLLAAGLGAAVRDHVMAANATAAGTSMATLEAGSRLSVRAVSDGGGGEAQAVNRIAGAVFAMLFYIASVMFGMAIASSVVEEKQSRIVEILATAIPLRQLLVGKVLGNAALAMGQLVLFVGVALVGVSFTDSGAMLPGLLGPSAWFLVFFAVGFMALACVWAVCGSLASRTEDLQATTMPMTMLLVGLLLLGLMGSGTTQVIASYVPIASVVTMPARLLAGTAAWWEPVLSLALTLAAAAALIAIAGRIYRRSLLQTGGRLSLRQALRVQE
uniref:ABC transporter permease n=1 Tax=Piscicoccus intestinalis TaxID=746033 RepID=UPI0008386500